MTYKQIYRATYDYKLNHRWAVVGKKQGRIIKIGRKYIHLMFRDGSVLPVCPSEIERVW